MLANKQQSKYFGHTKHRKSKNKEARVLVWDRILHEATKNERYRNDLTYILEISTQLRALKFGNKQITRSALVQDVLNMIQQIKDKYIVRYKNKDEGWILLTRHELIIKPDQIIDDISFQTIQSDKHEDSHSSFIQLKDNNYLLIGPLSLLNHHCNSSLQFKDNSDGQLVGICNVNSSSVKFPAGSEIMVKYMNKTFKEAPQDYWFQCICCNCVDNGVPASWQYLDDDDNQQLEDMEDVNSSEYVPSDDNNDSDYIFTDDDEEDDD